MNEELIELAELIEIRTLDGAQCFLGDSGEVYWLLGPNRARNVVVGDRGQIVMRTTGERRTIHFNKES